MILRRRSTRNLLTLDSELGSGGEARIYALANDTSLVAKVYHQSTDARINKLAAMLAQPPADPMAAKGHVSIAWPVDLLEETGTNRVVGFLMPRINAMPSIIHFYNPTLRSQQCPLFNYAYLHRTARNLAAAVRALHVRNYVIGDVNHDNILAADTALVTLVDTDSFQVPDPRNGTVYRCPVGTGFYTPSELQGIDFRQIDRAVVHDLFGLAVIIFQLLMEGVHPFSGSFTGVSDPSPQPEARITAGHFPYARKRFVPYQPTPVAPPFEVLHPTLRRLFLRCFEDGHSQPSVRPGADTWQDALEEAEQALVACAANDQHRYGNHLTRCPWCERANRLGFDSFPSPQALRNRQYAQAAGFAQKPLSPAGTARPAPAQPVHTTATIKIPAPSRLPARWTRRKVAAVFAALAAVLLVVIYNKGPVGTIEQEMVTLPAGEFQMGCSPGDDLCSYNEQPPHRVKIKSFRIGKYEVTQAQWRAVMGANPARFQGDDRPVENVSWNDIQDFLKRLNAGNPGKPYRLPTEAEWEYAARGGTQTRYWWGQDIGKGKANCDGCGSRWDRKETAPVGSFRANPFGLYDMAGNVWEWVADCWHDSYPGAPTDGSEWRDNCLEAGRVLRGGSWISDPLYLKVSWRDRNPPAARYAIFGLRLAQDL